MVECYDGNSTVEYAYASVEMEHDWKEGTAFHPHIHIMPSSNSCLLYTSPSPRDRQKSRMPSSA